MDYNQDEFYRMTSGDSRKLPFYMTYPMQNIFMEEAEYERDMARLKGMYAQEVREVQGLVDEECDKMEYEGSLMFDEFPDRLMLRQICERIYQQVAVPPEAIMSAPALAPASPQETVESEELRMTGQRPPFRPPVGPPHRSPHRPPNRPDDGLKNLIEVLLFNEMHNRRCRHRRCRRWW